VTADGSRAPVSVPGRRYLRIFARADFDGVLTVHLGLDDPVGHHIGELVQLVYLDVAACSPVQQDHPLNGFGRTSRTPWPVLIKKHACGPKAFREAATRLARRRSLGLAPL
jgi:hypothetical protein